MVGRLLPDNLKSAVIRASFGVDGEPALNRSYRELARYYGFQIDPTPVRSPEKKGKVESNVKYVRRNFLDTWDTVDIEEDRRQLRRWLVEIASDFWFHLVYDVNQRQMATYRVHNTNGPDSDPKEEFVHHQAGAGVRVFDAQRVILRDKDANTAWTTASDGTLEDRIYYCQNWQNDVAAIVDDAGEMVEWVVYSTFGVPFGISWGDADSDGDRDGTDFSIALQWQSPGYDVRGDVNLDGYVNSTDITKINGSTTTLGRGALSDVGSLRGFAGHEFDSDIDLKYHRYSLVFSCELNEPLQRGPDPLWWTRG